VPGSTLAVSDATGIEGGWDFTLTYSGGGVRIITGGRGGSGRYPKGGAAPAPVSNADGMLKDIEEQLGLKVVSHEQLVPWIVIDHIQRKPAKN
jgi:uncharacterized protein (TIGR03435 family)